LQDTELLSSDWWFSFWRLRGCSRASASGVDVEGRRESILGHFFSLHSLPMGASRHMCCQTLLQRRGRCGGARVGLRIPFAQLGGWPSEEEVVRTRETAGACGVEVCAYTNDRLTVRRKEPFLGFWQLSWMLCKT
jgi:hypothetical protein